MTLLRRIEDIQNHNPSVITPATVAAYHGPERRGVKGHPVSIYTADQVVGANLRVPEEIRLSHWLSNGSMSIFGAVLIDGNWREALFNRAFIEAIVDEVPPRRDVSMIVARTRLLVRVVFGSNLTVTGFLHVLDPNEWACSLNLEDLAFRAITEATITVGGQILRSDADALVNTHLATRIEILPTP
jgi:hypothetical protein